MTSSRPLDSHDPTVLQLLQLAAEAILAHPEAVPGPLHALVDAWADDLATALMPRSPDGAAEPAVPAGRAQHPPAADGTGQRPVTPAQTRPARPGAPGPVHVSSRASAPASTMRPED
jgi:hypothetical protein